MRSAKTVMIQFDERGFITHIRSDPESQQIIDAFLAKGDWLYLPGEPMPLEPLFAPSGEPILDEDGDQVVSSRGIILPDVTHGFHYVKAGKVVERPRLPVRRQIKADGADTFVVEWTQPFSIEIDGELVEVDDGRLEFATEDAGTYVFNAVFPFVDGSITVVAA